MSVGYNWRNTLVDYASISGVLGGFCVSFIAIILGWSIADTPLFVGLTFGYVSVLLFGISVSLFISSAGFFLIAKNFDLFDLPGTYEEWLQKTFESEGKDWYEIRNLAHKNCRRNEKFGRICYNTSIFVMLFGLAFSIIPYHFLVALIVAVLGVILELIQLDC